MKAAQLTQYGGKEAIVINDIPQPEVADDKVQIEVKAAGVNPFDWKIQNGYMKDFIPLQLPITLGGDFSGIVIKVGTNVTDFAEGEAVYGQANAVAGQSGSFAEFLVTSAGSIGKKPEKLSFLQAGAIPLTGVSAVQALYDHLNLQTGQKILIHGGAGGIGSIAIQIAKHIGAYVATTVSTNDVDFAKELGADEVIDYKTQKFEEILKEYDAVFDLVGGETNKNSYAVLKQGGKFVSMVQDKDESLTAQKQIEYTHQGTQVNTQRLNTLRELLDAGVIEVHIEKTFPLDQAADALDYLKNTPPKGKVVLTVKD